MWRSNLPTNLLVNVVNQCRGGNLRNFHDLDYYVKTHGLETISQLADFSPEEFRSWQQAANQTKTE